VNQGCAVGVFLSGMDVVRIARIFSTALFLLHLHRKYSVNLTDTVQTSVRKIYETFDVGQFDKVTPHTECPPTGTGVSR